MFDWTADGHLIVTSTSPAVLVSVGPFVIRYYALAYLAGIIGAWWLVRRMIRDRSHAPLGERDADDFVLYATLGIILGGRLGFVLFYNLDHYLDYPSEIPMIWKGGMSYHGGMLGVLTAVVIFTWQRKLDWVRFHDYLVCAAPIGLFTGRLANFINGELWGAPTKAAWGTLFYTDPDRLIRHPTQLYEAWLEGIVLLVILGLLFWRTDARLKRGLLSGLFLLGYGVFRFLVEYVREPDVQLVGKTGMLHMGQWLCVPMILAGLWLMIRARRIA